MNVCEWEFCVAFNLLKLNILLKLLNLKVIFQIHPAGKVDKNGPLPVHYAECNDMTFQAVPYALCK